MLRQTKPKAFPHEGFLLAADTRTPHDSKHSNLGGAEEKRDTVCRKARGQFLNNPCGWSYRQAGGIRFKSVA